MYPEYLIELIDKAFDEAGFNDAGRCDDLKARYARYPDHPILKQYNNQSSSLPSPLIDAALWEYLNDHFDNAFDDFSLPTYFIPVPLVKNRAFVEENDKFIAIFVNEYEIFLIERYAFVILGHVSEYFTIIDELPCSIDDSIIEVMGDAYRKNTGDYKEQAYKGFLDLSLELMKIIKHIISDDTYINAKYDIIDGATFLSQMIACNRIADSDISTFEKRISAILNLNYPIEIDEGIYDTINSIMIGYMFRFIAHEVVHRDHGHLSLKPKIFYPEIAKSIDLKKLNKIREPLIEIEADIYISTKWFKFSQKNNDKYQNIFIYLGMIWASLIDYIYAHVTLVCSRGKKLSEFEEWICRSINREHRALITDVIGDYPTELERMEASLLNPMLMSSTQLEPDFVRFIFKITALINLSIIDHANVIFDMIQNNKIPNLFGCEKCNTINPFLGSNMMAERLDRFEKICPKRKQELYDVFLQMRANPDNSILELPDEFKSKLKNEIEDFYKNA